LPPTACPVLIGKMFVLSFRTAVILVAPLAVWGCGRQIGKLAGEENLSAEVGAGGASIGSGLDAAGGAQGGAEVGVAGGPGTGEVRLSSGCTIPEPPPVELTSRRVGDGSPESCTNASVQAALTSGGHVTFDCGSDPITIPISSTLMVEADALVDGAGSVTLDGLHATRILWANNGLKVQLEGLTFTRGSALGAEPLASGGAVRGGWGGELYIKDCLFTDNEAGVVGKEGGAGVSAPSHTSTTIVNSHFEGNVAGTGPAVHSILSGLTIVDSVFVNNEATTDGGGAVYTDGASDEVDDDVGGTISLCGSRFTSNVASFQGGGAYLWGYDLDTVRVSQCVFEGNRVNFSEAERALGGALRIGDATLYVDGSLFVDNHTDDKGGAIWVNGNYPSHVTNSTFIRNHAGTTGRTIGGRGGAITGSHLVMANLTFDSNSAENGAGAVFNNAQDVDAQSSTLRNSILLNNHTVLGRVPACRIPMEGENNLQWPEPDAGDHCTEGSIYADPLLGDLQDNGGATHTRALSEESPALAQGTNCSNIDQRGEPRPEACDLGAFELEN